MRLMWQTIGQPKIIDLLQRSLEGGTLSHAYLLIGPAQVGKRTLALDLAKALNCLSEEKSRPCGSCSSCRKIAAGKHADVEIIRVLEAVDSEDGKGKTEIGVDQIKKMIHSSFLPPFEGKYRIFIIDDAAQTSLEAANRLLKTLEEHKGSSVFILLTTNVKLIPATVISRCQRLNFSKVATQEIETSLVRDWNIEPDRARLLARLSRGCPGWAIESAQKTNLVEERDQRFAELQGLMQGDYGLRFGMASQLALQFSRKRENVYEVLDTWLSWWRDLLLVKTGCDNDVININHLPDLVEMAGAYNLSQVRNAIRYLLQSIEHLKVNANARLALEALMLNLPAPAVESAVRQRVGV
jgi:DNA polymerase III subunit delta'